MSYTCTRFLNSIKTDITLEEQSFELNEKLGFKKRYVNTRFEVAYIKSSYLDRL